MCPPIQLISFWVVLNMIQIWKPHLILITTVTQWDGAKRNNLRSLVVWLWPVWCHQFGVASVAPSTICIINQDFHSTHQVSWWIWRTVNWRQVQWNISGDSQWMCMQLITLQSGQWQISLVHLSCCCQCPLLIRPPVQCPVQRAIELTMLQCTSGPSVCATVHDKTCWSFVCLSHTEVQWKYRSPGWPYKLRPMILNLCDPTFGWFAIDTLGLHQYCRHKHQGGGEVKWPGWQTGHWQVRYFSPWLRM